MQNRETRPTVWQCPDWPLRATVSLVFAATVAFAFRDFLAECVSRWATEPQYSHGYLIPFMSVGLGWFRRDRVLAGLARSSFWGLFLLIPGAGMHLLANYMYFAPLDGLALLFVLVGGVLLIWGRRLFVGIWPAVLFPGFMMPLPYELEHAMSAPLQMLGASEAAFYIQTCGIPAIAQGNTILMGDTQLGVEEACSGLRMLMVFTAISVSVVILSKRPRWERMVILFSAVPIALICNIARIVATAIAHHYLGQQTADLVFHDLSGWLMIPMGLGLLLAAMKTFDWLFVEVRNQSPALGITGVSA
ncbi:MAG: exosortase/archaeosortase family protein [Planctomycetaceae bacterium]